MVGELAVMDLTGDTKLIWDTSRTDEVEVARETFDKLKRKGYIAYSVKDGGDKGDILREFNPNAGKIIMAPPMVGG